MGETTSAPRRSIAVLNHPEYEVARFITLARWIVQSMRDNRWFPRPSPPLAKIEAAIEALFEAETATRSRTQGTVQIRDEKRVALVTLLQQLMGYVQIVADANPDHSASIIVGSGFSLKKWGGRKPRVLAAEPGPVSGTVALLAPRVRGATAHRWRCSTDGGKTYVELTPTAQGSTTVTGLRPGSTVYFQWCPVMRKGEADWSQPVALIVV